MRMNQRWRSATATAQRQELDKELVWFSVLKKNNVNEQDNAYLIAVKTSDRFGAETDAEVTIRLIGSRNQSDPIVLHDDVNEINPRLTRKQFRRNQIDLFLIHGMPDLGEIEQIEVGHDESGQFPVWHLEWISVYKHKPAELNKFPYRSWIGRTSYLCSSMTIIHRHRKASTQCAVGELEKTLKKILNV